MTRAGRLHVVQISALVFIAIAIAGSGIALGGTNSGTAPNSFDPGLKADLEDLAQKQGEQTLVGSYLAQKISVLEAHGQVLDSFAMQIEDPDGHLYAITYAHNHGQIEEYQRTRNFLGVPSDTFLSRMTIDTPESGRFTPSDLRLADPPSDAFVRAIDDIDAQHRARLAPTDPQVVGPLGVLGIVGRAAAATPYDYRQNYADLTFGFLITRWGTGNHSMTLDSYGYWYGPCCAYADPGDENDGMDAEWDPSDMYMTGVYWVPSVAYTAGPFSWHGIHNISMISSDNHAQLGADYQKPDKNSKYNDLYVQIAPKSSSVYGRGMNAYANYIHSWNFSLLGGVTFTARFGLFAISWAPIFTGDWEKNLWRALSI